MGKVIDVIHRLLPKGSNPSSGMTDHQLFPVWPPDLFAVAATLVQKSSVYAHPNFAGGIQAYLFDQHLIDDLEQLGKDWAIPIETRLPTHNDIQRWMMRLVQSRINDWWKELLQSGESLVQDREVGQAPSWWVNAFLLMIVADEAAAGFGFIQPSNQPWSYSPNQVFESFDHYLQDQPAQMELPYTPFSLCKAVPACEVCVLPKTQTSQSGCTLNSYSHHLSLLPSKGEVQTSWHFATKLDELEDEEQSQALKINPTSTQGLDPNPYKNVITKKAINVMLVPFPYAIADDAFVKGPACSPSIRKKRNPAHFFDVEQTWLNHDGKPISADQLCAELLEPLIAEAQKAGFPPHIIVFPELALHHDLVRDMAKRLCKIEPLELMISGIHKPGEAGQPGRNAVHWSIFHQNEVFDEWYQSKHHRWKIDKSQVMQYGLENVLPPTCDWWERIDISSREVFFWVFRQGASLATLVCEDLARIDPVQQVLRSVGPNLLITLLMDGPQLKFRWPARYATSLADDPGTSVLTLTSWGMLARSGKSWANPSRVFALWKEAPGLSTEETTLHSDIPGLNPGEVLEIGLAEKHHAVLLNMQCRDVEAYSMDGRPDNGNTVRIHVQNKIDLRHPSMPPWTKMQ